MLTIIVTIPDNQPNSSERVTWEKPFPNSILIGVKVTLNIIIRNKLCKEINLQQNPNDILMKFFLDIGT